jgi:hypothetical protein
MESQNEWDDKTVSYFMILIGCGILGIVCIYVGMAGLAFGFGLNAGICGGILITRKVPSPEENPEEHF